MMEQDMNVLGSVTLSQRVAICFASGVVGAVAVVLCQRTTGEWVLYGVGLLATIAATIFVTRVARKALQKKITSAEAGGNPQSL